VGWIKQSTGSFSYAIALLAVAAAAAALLVLALKGEERDGADGAARRTIGTVAARR
jgi:hypothetical protein